MADQDQAGWNQMVEPADHTQCAAWIKGRFAALGCDATVSTIPPIFKTVYEQTPFRCPHGTLFYHAPTPEQITAWARDGVA